MERKKPSPVVVALLLVTAENVLLFPCCNGDAHVRNCSESDREALLGFKNALKDPQNRLSSWAGNNCCQWRGVWCDQTTGAVARIDLNNRCGYWNLGGNISSSLLKLRSSLKYMDLSFNSFGSVPIPGFLGQLVHLQYLNLSNSGFSGLIPPSLGNLSSLAYLDLSSEFPGSLSADTIDWLSGMSSLRFLGLGGVDLSVVGPNWINALNSLPHLSELHLQDCGLTGLIPSLGSPNFTSLAVLDLHLNPLSSEIPMWIMNISGLEYLDMSFSGLFGRISLGFRELPNLKFLILSGNNISASCSQLFHGSWSRIEVLDLASNRIHGRILSSVGNMTSLTDFGLSANNVEGGIPATIGSLCGLVRLDLSSNNLTDSLPESLLGTGDCILNDSLPSLMHLRLSNNQLSGLLPDWLGQLRSLVELSLDYNSLQGHIPASLGKLPNLTSLGLAGNELNGTLPSSLGELSEISAFDVSFNHLTGTLLEEHFRKLSKLKILHLSSNSFILSVSSRWIPPFQVRNLDMGSCRLGPSFPAWLQSQTEIRYLDLSNASISGPMPEWFSEISSNLSLLNVSLNRLQGQLPNPLKVSPFADVDLSSNLFQGPIRLPSAEIELLDLSDNQFSGHIPLEISKAMPNLIFLSLASNQITGPIPATMGEMQYLQIIDISGNRLSGRIPSSIGNCSLLKALDLKNNNLSGEIPNGLGQLVQLQSLHLSNNRLTGHLPASLQNLSSLEMLDLGNNRLKGGIPPWLSDGFIKLRILILRSNKFSGELLPLQLSGLPSLQVLDLAENNFTGQIPPSLGDFKSMAQEKITNRYLFYGFYRGTYYKESLTVTTKGEQREFTKTLSLVTSIDLSGNNIDGELPEQITKLTGLSVLNLSRNSISGQIPESISNMHQLSSLDLSSNRLSGAIPASMSSSLTFLGYLNLSYNNFSGKIPYSEHMTTFDASSFAGNPSLCGPPLKVDCPREEGSGQGLGEGEGEGGVDASQDDDAGFIDGWFYLSLGVGFAAGLLIPFIALLIRKPWSHAYFSFVDGIVDRWLFNANGRARWRGNQGRSRR